YRLEPYIFSIVALEGTFPPLQLCGVHIAPPNTSHFLLLLPDLIDSFDNIQSINFLNGLCALQDSLFMFDSLCFRQNHYISPFQISLFTPFYKIQSRRMEWFQDTSPAEYFLNNICYIIH